MHKNLQAPEKRTHNNRLIDVHSIFYTIQGEGPFCGTPAVFIRLAGCNLQCDACDTDYTSRRELMHVDELCNAVQRAWSWHSSDSAAYSEALSEKASSRHTGLVVITGGEPFRQDLDSLCARLLAMGCYVQVETNGTLPVTISASRIATTVTRGPYQPIPRAVFVVCSPKTGSVHSSVLDFACCFKYVMNVEHVGKDGLPTRALHHPCGQLARPPKGDVRPVYLQPMDEQNHVLNSQHLQACVDSCMKHGYILQLQIHKILRME